MRRIVTWAMSTLSALVLLFSYHTSTSSTSTAGQVTATAGKAGASGKSGSIAPGAPAVPGAPGSQNGLPNGSGSTGSGSGGSGNTAAQGTAYAGTAVGTRFGNVQVQITVAAGRITGASVLQIPNRDRKDVQINNRAVPILNQEVVAAQSADIDMVSGATVTSVAYIQSLQSAIDKAHL